MKGICAMWKVLDSNPKPLPLKKKEKKEEDKKEKPNMCLLYHDSTKLNEPGMNNNNIYDVFAIRGMYVTIIELGYTWSFLLDTDLKQ